MEKDNNSLNQNQDVLDDSSDETWAMKEKRSKLSNHLTQNEHLPRLQNAIVSQILPTEILLEIFKFLPHENRKQVRLVCKHFQSIIDSITKTTLKIENKNVAEIRARIEEKNIDGLNFKKVRLLRFKRAGDIKFILHSIGQQIDDLSIYATEIWDNFTRLVPNLKSLALVFCWDSKYNSTNISQCEFPLLEKLVLMYNRLETDLLLTKISEPNSTIALKELQLECKSRCNRSIQTVLKRHANSLEILDILFIEPRRIGWALTLSKMHKLKKIHLREICGNGFLRTIFNAIPKLSALEVIWIDCYSGYNFADPITWDLRELKKLRELKLLNCPLPNAQLIGQRPLMEILHVTTKEKIKEMDLIRLISCFPNLRTLLLNIDQTAMTNTILSYIFRHQTRLQSLTIDDCTNITVDGLIGTKDDPYPISRLKYLGELRLHGLENLTDQALSEFQFPRLRILDLGQSNKITSKGLEILITNCPRLQELRISNDTADNDNALFIIRNGLKQLNRLIITNCHREDYRNVFNSLKDPLTNEPFASKCDLFLCN